MAQCQAIIAALTTLTVTDYMLGGKDFPKAALIAAFQSYLDAATLNASTKKSYQNAVIAETAQAASARSLRALLKAFLQSRFGKNSPELTPFSFSPTKTAKKTVAIKVVAIAKMDRTKTALNTMGSKERKAAIKKIAAIPMPEPAPVPAPAPPPARARAPPPAPASTGITPTAVDRLAIAVSKAVQAPPRTENGS